MKEWETIGLLDKEKSGKLAEITDELRHTLDTEVPFRTRTEAVCSVLDDVHFPTVPSKYHQAKREQKVMIEGLIQAAYMYKKLMLKKQKYENERDRLKHNIEKVYINDEFDLKEMKIELEETELEIKMLEYQIEMIRREANDRAREILMWSDIKKELENTDAFDKDNRDTDELIALTKRYCAELPMAIHNNTDTGSMANIMGQTVALLKECERRGILDRLSDTDINIKNARINLRL